MIIGSTSTFAIESGILRAYERPGLRALGYFVIYLKGQSFGQTLPNSTMMACSLDAVSRRVAERGKHIAAFAEEADAESIAVALREGLYADSEKDAVFFGASQAEFSRLIYSKGILWAPDGDEAFDDGSYIAQFDIGDRVRLIGFKSVESFVPDSDTLRDLWLSADDFYDILRHWLAAFEIEWNAAPKVSDDDPGLRMGPHL